MTLQEYVVKLAVEGTVFVKVKAESEWQACAMAPGMAIWSDAENRTHRVVDVIEG